MEANILEGVYVKVGGQAGRTNGLAWHILENMFNHMQELIALLAKYELETDQSPNLKDFEIEIFDFKHGSAVPAFRVVPAPTLQLFPKEVLEQRVVVANRFDTLMAYADKGEYESFFSADSLPDVKHEIAEELYGFILSAENSPLSIVRKNGDGKFHDIYKVPRFTRQQADALLRPKRRRKAAAEPEEILGLIRRVGKKNKIIDLYENKDTVISIAPPAIILPNKIYNLHSPIVCKVYREDDTYIVENDILDLYASGVSIDEAEHDFYSEFDSSYELLNSLPDIELSERLLRAKRMMKEYIKEIVIE